MSKNQHTLNLLNTINKSINSINAIKKRQSILISISGGQDSICLFFILIQLKKQWEWSFGIIYCNHLWQKPSFVTASLVIRIAYLFKIPVHYIITTSTIFNEEDSRHWRYKVFYRIIFFYNYKITTTGHTSSDKIETMVFQLIRGASSTNFLALNNIKHFSSNNKFTTNCKITNVCFFSLKKLNVLVGSKYQTSKTESFSVSEIVLFPNLKSEKQSSKFSATEVVPYSLLPCFLLFKKKLNKIFHKNYFIILNKKINRYNKNSTFKQYFLVRPILVVDRFDLKKFLLFLDIPLYPDDSNQKKIYYRNRIRKQLLPTLKFFFNPQVDTSFSQFSIILLDEQFHLNLLLKELIVEYYSTTQKYCILNIPLFIKLPKTIQRKIIKQLLGHSTKSKIGFHNVEKILKSLIKQKPVYKNILIKNYFHKQQAKITLKSQPLKHHYYYNKNNRFSFISLTKKKNAVFLELKL